MFSKAHISKANKIENIACLYALSAINRMNTENSWEIKNAAEPIDREKIVSSLLDRLTNHC